MLPLSGVTTDSAAVLGPMRRGGRGAHAKLISVEILNNIITARVFLRSEKKYTFKMILVFFNSLVVEL